MRGTEEWMNAHARDALTYRARRGSACAAGNRHYDAATVALPVSSPWGSITTM